MSNFELFEAKLEGWFDGVVSRMELVCFAAELCNSDRFLFEKICKSLGENEAQTDIKERIISLLKSHPNGGS